MTRMIERWFPCAEVSEASAKGWGSGNTERNLFTWFAARPTAQAKAAVITSLLPWPEDEAEQKHLQELVRDAMKGRYKAWTSLRDEIVKANPAHISVLDPFSGRGMIPLEAARLGLGSFGVDYSPVAVLASELLIDYPFRDWASEPRLPFAAYDTLSVDQDRLLLDVDAVLEEIGRKFTQTMSAFYPAVDGIQPWGYLWAVTLPCQECGNRFPLVGSYELRKSNPKTGDAGQSFYVVANREEGSFQSIVHEGPPRRTPTLSASVGAGGKKARGKNAICPFCDHVHPLAVHQRLASDGLGRDALLVVGENDPEVGKFFRAPTDEEFNAATSSSSALKREEPFSPVLPAVPKEDIPVANGATIRPALYGASTYGDLYVDRQALGFVRLSRLIADFADVLTEEHGVSSEYASALVGYAAAALVRKIKYSTRGATLQIKPGGAVMINHIFVNESTIAFSYDSFEAGIGDGPGTWNSLRKSTVSTLRSLMADRHGAAGSIQRGSATSLPFKRGSMTVVVTDPPYDAMVYYSDSSDLFYAWLKRALHSTRPGFGVTGDPRGIQEKTNEIIVKEHGKAPGEHRTRQHYDSNISLAFSEMRRVVHEDGVVTIVFGHGEPEVWHRLLNAISGANLVLTGSWPAKTEAGGQQGKANIVTTLTMSCRPAPQDRAVGRAAVVEAEVRAEIADRMKQWGRYGLAPTDMLMASAGPAMEIVGRYSKVLNNKGEEVLPDRYLVVARRAVQDAEAVEIDHHPLDTFDARTRFALWWVRLFRKGLAPKSELRWQSLASDMDVSAIRDLVPDSTKGCQFVSAKYFKSTLTSESPVVDVALAMAKVWPDGLDAVGEVLTAAGRQEDDSFLWAAISFLADRLPDADPDAIAWTGMLRSRTGVQAAARGVTAARAAASREREGVESQPTLFDDENFGEQ
ncbi:hypothetical protein [Paenarthrobacter nicotinovorans]|uniref:hypothetical protein n=1 Tax=Paenarthrobacter nicotinovorans TaxID=29320 RepID=UPI0024860C94|nr:hypothetical protein [Paenarthrobacter nicotinovorans]MDI2019998.1 hypothetical protein [Paenarthrobacter nicotinovorans]